MPRAPWASDAIYTAAERFVDDCLRQDGSLFAPGHAVWTAQNATDLYERVGPWGEGGKFWEKLDAQVATARPEVKQIAAEAMFVQYLAEDTTSGASKRATLENLLDSAVAEIPADLAPALDSGLADPGAGKAHRPTYLRFLLDFARRWKESSDDEREALLDDPWAFRDFVKQVPGGGAQVEALIHLVFPDTFEPIVSSSAKLKVAATFSGIPGVSEESDVDRKLVIIRAELDRALGEGLAFYRSAVRPVWEEPESPEWEAFLGWAARLHPRDDWDENERTYKLEIAGNLRAVRDALDSEDWLPLLKRAFGRPNNLTNRFEHAPFLEWCENSSEDAQRFLGELWEGDHRAVLRGAMHTLPRDVLSGRAARASVASFLLLARDPTQFPFFRMTVYESTSRLVGRDTVSADANIEELYDDFVELLDELRVRMLLRGATVDRLDAQGLAWWITGADPPEDWSPEQRQAFLAYRAGEPQPEPQRAWLVRGANNQGRNMLSEWFEERFVSIGWDNATPYPLDASEEEIREHLRSDLPEAPEGAIVRGAGIGRRFLDIAPGDLIVTPDGDDLYIARAAGAAGWADGDTASALRRPVEWFNRDSPASRASVRRIAPELWSSLRTLLTVSDLTQHVQEVAALLNRSDDGVKRVTATSAIPPATEDLARELFLDGSWLQEVIELLNEKRQIVFYGPPGTGKTYVARALGRHVEEAGGTWRLVQFHPAYNYEDFFEGYRPSDSGRGLEFSLVPGPLRDIAQRAETDPSVPHLIVIDEINRGNIAKIFGELYFLLEYRNEPIQLQYSPQIEFRLPKNLYFVGTMNTADRSIALVDSALRRRFYFVGFFPREAPLRTVLRDWLQANDYPNEAAELQRELNAALADSGADEEFAIGHAYFMGGGQPDVKRVWRRAIMPLLEERFYGARTRQEVHKEFGVDAIVQRLRAEDAEDEIAAPDDDDL